MFKIKVVEKIKTPVTFITFFLNHAFIIIFIYLLQLGYYPVAVVILHVNKTRNRLLINLSLECYMRSM